MATITRHENWLQSRLGKWDSPANFEISSRDARERRFRGKAPLAVRLRAALQWVSRQRLTDSLSTRGLLKTMTATHILKPTIIEAAGRPAKQIEEFVGHVNSGTSSLSIARMVSPQGWNEPGQTPEFDEFTVVLRGQLHVKLKDREFDVAAGQAVIIPGGEWVQYSTPQQGGAEYIAVCLPAFSPKLVHRDGQQSA
jgi:mannose-6-phosphate isomerase-like protein (cupin superfamily)